MKFTPVLRDLLIGAVAAMAVCAGIAEAAPAKPAAAPAQDQGQGQAEAPGAATPTDTKTVGDWSVRCFPVNTASPCDMYEELADRTTHQRVLGISIAFIPSSNRHAIQIAVPLGVAIPAGVVIKAGSYTSPMLKYRRCDRAGCYVETLIDNAVVDGLAHAGTPDGTVKIVANNSKPFDLRVSLNGFAGAHDAMMELARQKAKAPAAAPAK